MLASARAFPTLHPGAAPDRAGLEAFAITQIPGEPTARACLAACLELILSGEAATPAGRKQFDELAEAVAVMHPQSGQALAQGVQTAQARDDEDGFDSRRNRDDRKFIHHRKLTPGEITLAMTVFGTDIPYDLVKVHDHGWEGFLVFQKKNVAVAPNGDIYARRDGTLYSDDYSTADFRLQALFIHEMAHVWQKRTMGMDMKLRGIFERQYTYTIEPGKSFSDYKLEQQAALVGDYFRFLHGQEPINGRPLIRGEPVGGNTALAVYRRLLPFVPD